MTENTGPKTHGEKSFADLVDDDVRPLSGEARPPRRGGAPRAPVAEAPVPFKVEHLGEEFEGRAPGVSKRDLRRFGAVATEFLREVDLHGLTATEARAAVFQALADAREEGERWLHVIHGRGLRSEGEAVLRRALPGWLTEAPHGAFVLAFRCSSRLPGATGATRVWLRREGPRTGGPR